MNGEDIRLAIGMLIGMQKDADGDSRIDAYKVFKDEQYKGIDIYYKDSTKRMFILKNSNELQGTITIGDFPNLSRESQRQTIKLIKMMIDRKMNPKGGTNKTEE